MNLITSAEVVALAFPDRNFLSAKILDSHIQVAQEAFLRPALGEDFYALLTSLTPEGDNATLVNDYLKPALAYYVRFVILPDIMVHAANSGLNMVQPQGTVIASDRQAGLLRDQARQNAETLLTVAMRYIQQNPSLFPLYEFSSTTRSRTRLLGGVIFSRKRRLSEPPTPSGSSIYGAKFLKTVADVRALATYNNGDIVICLDTNGIYEFSLTESSDDDGEIYLKPNGTDTGRWVRIKELQTVNL